MSTELAKKRGSLLKQVLGVVVPLCVTIGLCVVLFRDIPFDEVVEAIRCKCDFGYIGLMLGLGLLPLLFRAIRWRMQLQAAGVKVSLKIVLYSVVGMYAVNLVLPRLGEIWRTSYIAYRQKAEFSKVFGSMVADRVADMLTCMVFVVAAFVVAERAILDFIQAYPNFYEQLMGIMSSPLTYLMLGLFVMAVWLIFTRCNMGWVKKIREFIVGLWNGFAAVGRMNGKGRWLLMTILIWGIYFAQMVVAFGAFPETRQLFHAHGLEIVLVCFVLTSFSMLVPSNGGIGPYQTALLFGLMLYLPHDLSADATKDFVVTATAFGNIIIAAQTLLMIVLGLIIFLLIYIDRQRANSERA